MACKTCVTSICHMSHSYLVKCNKISFGYDNYVHANLFLIASIYTLVAETGVLPVDYLIFSSRVTDTGEIKWAQAVNHMLTCSNFLFSICKEREVNSDTSLRG